MNLCPFLFSFILAAEMRRADLRETALWLAIAAAISGLAGLLILIFKLVKMFREATVCRVPLAATNEVEINRTGELFLRFEVPKESSMTGRHLHYELLNRQRYDAPVKLKPVPNPLTVKSGQKRSFPICIFHIAETGKYLLKVSGFDPQKDYSGCSLVISRLRLLNAVLYILGIVLTGLMFVGGLVVSIIAITANK